MAGWLLVKSILYPSQRFMVPRDTQRRKVGLLEEAQQEVALFEEPQRKMEEDAQ